MRLLFLYSILSPAVAKECRMLKSSCLYSQLLSEETEESQEKPQCGYTEIQTQCHTAVKFAILHANAVCCLT